MLVTLRDQRIKTVRPIDKKSIALLGSGRFIFCPNKKTTLDFPSAKPHMETCTS